MRTFLTLMLLMLSPIQVWSQRSSSQSIITTRTLAQISSEQSDDRPSEDLKDLLRPSLVALSVADLDETVKWYRDNLGFVVKQKNEFPDYSLRVAFMELNAFEIELVEDKKSVSLSAIQKSFPEVSDGTRIQGFVKLAFTVSNVKALADKLRRNHVTFQIELTESNRTKGVTYFIVRDNNGNWIQFFGSDGRTQ